MKSLKSVVLAAALLTVPAIAQAAVEVSFTNSAKFTDAFPRGWRFAKERDQTLGNLQAFIVREAQRHLAPGQDLKVEIIDVDLAGRTNTFLNPNDIRLMTSVDSPAIKLRYTLSENGRTLVSREERVIDLNYQMSIGLSGNSDPLRYEKSMLRNWMGKRFGRRVG